MAGRPDGRTMANGARGALALLAALALAGCEEGLGAAMGDAITGAPASAATGPTDIAAPDLFHVAEPGLWDGRPSLGGVWVAHPDAVDPERVRVVNQDNGQEIIGALFRRERDLPGPALQVSSDAAEALGMLAGAPANLDVTALRRQEAPPPAEPQPAPAEEAAPEPAPAEPAPAEAPAQPAAPSDLAAGEAIGRAAAAILAGSAAAPAPTPQVATTSLDAAPAAGTAPAASPLNFPFVQLGTFSVEASVTEAAQALAAKGLPARIVRVRGQDSWRLLLGPIATESDQEALLARAKAEGFADAYLVRS